MSKNPISVVAELGQSVWLDSLSRDLIRSGRLERMIREEGLRGVTSNPKILAESISEGHGYDEEVRRLSGEGKTATEIYERLAIGDIQDTADLLRPVYDASGGQDGFVSLEVSPHLAHDAGGTIAEACRLWSAVDRPNLMIKVPATSEGLPAIRRLIGEGVNVNVTLLFGLKRYQQAVDAYLRGLEDRRDSAESLDRIASVASFFLSRIDVLIDAELDRIIETGGASARMAEGLRGNIAIASAKLAYQIYKHVFEDKRFRKLAQHGAHTQRLLWGSTSTKDPRYSDVKYVEELIGPKTVNTVPLQTLEAYQNHGNPEPRLERGVDEARRRLEQLPALGIDLERVTRRLEKEGVEKFAAPYDQLLSTLERLRKAA